MQTLISRVADRHLATRRPPGSVRLPVKAVVSGDPREVYVSPDPGGIAPGVVEFERANDRFYSTQFVSGHGPVKLQHGQVLENADEVRDAVKAALPRLPKTASQREVMEAILPARKMYDLVDAMEKEGDKQSADLAVEVYQKLVERLTLTDNEEYALNRLQNSVSRIGSWDAATQRNNIFKAADLLKLKLPSHFFASDKSAGAPEDLRNAQHQVAHARTLLRFVLDNMEDNAHPAVPKIVDLESRLEEVELEFPPLYRMLRTGSDRTAAKAIPVITANFQHAAKDFLYRLENVLLDQGFKPSNLYVSAAGGLVIIGGDVLDPQLRDEAAVRDVIVKVLGHREVALERKTAKVHRDDKAWWFRLQGPLDLGIVTL